ncbi:hypothetical protein E2C01_073551 [Portunus trituberculatus]|uniref:Uncharacterized protein n=1 Tax=Portunus trituberculatus TaxID=210409 RepID=A0A5B7I3B7_PORTR|nr:hypothetical protein [Portunus trituberculatus]
MKKDESSSMLIQRNVIGSWLVFIERQKKGDPNTPDQLPEPVTPIGLFVAVMLFQSHGN